MAADEPDQVASIELCEFDVTEEPMVDPRVRRLPQTAQRQIEAFTEAIVGEGRVGEHLGELESLVDRYPGVPRLQNYLAMAYEMVGRKKQARTWVNKTFEQFPDYVFALSNYVRYCLHEGDVAEAGRALDKRFLISHFARGRKRFHLSEVVAYQGVVAEYLLAVGQWESARRHLDMLLELAPDHPQVWRLAGKLTRRPLRKMLANLRRLQRV